MKRRNIERVTFRAEMSRKEIGWRMVLVRLATSRRELEALRSQVKHMAELLAAKAEQLRKAHKERELRRVLVKLGLLR